MEPTPFNSRSTLTKALEIGRDAVRLDVAPEGVDYHEAIVKYEQCAAMVQQVIGHVQGTVRKDSKAHREEVRRMKSIQETYAERAKILRLIHNIPS